MCHTLKLFKIQSFFLTDKRVRMCEWQASVSKVTRHPSPFHLSLNASQFHQAAEFDDTLRARSPILL